MSALPEWKPLPGPDLERVLIAGWQPPAGSCIGYWWYHEDCLDAAGMPIDTPHATHWCHIFVPPYPASPERAA